jgi:hypothetical protein
VLALVGSIDVGSKHDPIVHGYGHVEVCLHGTLSSVMTINAVCNPYKV